jgi:hypothetical protein
MRPGGAAAAISSIQTEPVNSSRGPAAVSVCFLRMSMTCRDSLQLDRGPRSTHTERGPTLTLSPARPSGPEPTMGAAAGVSP